MVRLSSTIRWLIALTLNVSVLLLPILSIPTCCCASSVSSGADEECGCCMAEDNCCQSQCCVTSRHLTESDEVGSCCEGDCQCSDAIASGAILELSRHVQHDTLPLVAILDWSFVPVANSGSCSCRFVSSLPHVASHNQRQSLLALWLK